MKCRRLIKLLSLIFVVLFSFSLTGCKFYNNQENDEEIIDREYTREEMQIVKTAQDVALLEKLSQNYNEENYIKRVAIYIRSERYNDSKWSSLGGSVDENFAQIVANYEPDLTYLKSNGNLIDPASKDEIDFIHMFATINMLLVGKSNADLGGWAGDLCQLVNEISSLNPENFEEAYTIAQQKFNKTSTFGRADVLADLDAVNIVSIYNNLNSKSLAKAMQKYYIGLTNEKRIQFFNSYLFSNSTQTAQEKYDYVLKRLKNNLLITLLNRNYGINYTDNEIEFNACIKVFVDFLLNAE